MDDPNRTETQFKSAIFMTEIAIELKERCTLAEKYLIHLRQLFQQANRAIVTLQSTSKCSLQQAKRLLQHNNNQSTKNQDTDKLLSIIENQLSDFDDAGAATSAQETIDLEASLSERLRLLDTKHKQHDLPPTQSSKSIKSDVDEKYPENWSRDSSIDLNTVVNLPPVPEDVFSSFTTQSNRPKRSSSLSSLKSMRKVKLFLQRAETSDDDDMSSDDDRDNSHKGDSDDGGGSPAKKYLGNITEESQFD